MNHLHQCNMAPGAASSNRKSLPQYDPYDAVNMVLMFLYLCIAQPSGTPPVKRSAAHQPFQLNPHSRTRLRDKFRWSATPPQVQTHCSSHLTIHHCIPLHTVAYHCIPLHTLHTIIPLTSSAPHLPPPWKLLQLRTSQVADRKTAPPLPVAL